MATADGIRLDDRSRKYSINSSKDFENLEAITYPPSTELIPDEYKHESESGLVVIFYGSSDTPNMNILKQALTDQNYRISEENVIKLTKKETISTSLTRLAKTDHSDKTCLLIFLMGSSVGQDLILPDDEEEENTISIKDVWMPFTRDNCEFMRNKPKIFVFQSREKLNLIHYDSTPRGFNDPPKEAYKLPAEADMLVIYKKVQNASSQENFIEQFCNNLDDFGKKDDIIGIISRFEDETDQRPLIISTLTRKFYITSSSHRGHHLDFTANHDSLLEMIEEVNQKVKNLYDYRRKVRGRNSMRKNLTVTDSLPNSNEEPSNQNNIQSERTSRVVTGANTPTRKANSIRDRPRWRN